MIGSDESVADDLHRVVESIGGSDRSNQAEMAEVVDEAINDQKVLLVQAGTGTGKSLGYLVPAIRRVLSDGDRVVIATATLALQRQLVERDLPAVISAVGAGAGPGFAVLKGRGNYICLSRLNSAGSDDPEAAELGLDLAQGTLEVQARQLREWSEASDTGDRDDYPARVDARVWRSMSATGRECVGPSRCEYSEECFSERARAAAAAAEVVVTNHALLALETMEDSSVIPEHQVLIVDEAHEFVARATSAATSDLSVAETERGLRAARAVAGEAELTRLSDAVAAMESVFSELPPEQQLFASLPSELVHPLAAVRDAAHLVRTVVTKDDSVPATQRQRILSVMDEVHDVAGRLLAATADDVVWWGGSADAKLHVAPLSVADQVGEVLRRADSAILTSATLTLGGDFTTMARELGLEGAAAWSGVDVGSPFDYPRQAILYVAADLPRPGRDGLPGAVLDRIVELITAAGGRSLVLLSSWRAVDAVADHLADESRLTEAGVEILVQQRGESVSRLVGEFGADESSVLVGTRSLFQGVDVPGPACSCVIIDRIPFPRPDDPILSARSRRVERSGGNGFMGVSVPQAALLLAQGSGRLIRAHADRGVVAILDPRLATARYGSFLLRSLPDFWRTTDKDVALGALARLTDGSREVGG